LPAVVELSETMRAPPERVFAYRRDLGNLPEYNPDVTRLTGEGRLYHFHVRVFGPISWPTTLTVTEASAPTRLVFEMTSLMDARETCVFEPTEDGTCVHFELRVASPGGIFGRWLDRWFVVPTARRQIAAELAKIKERLERG
jgi:uncharacterized membrane protein